MIGTALQASFALFKTGNPMGFMLWEKRPEDVNKYIKVHWKPGGFSKNDSSFIHLIGDSFKDSETSGS